MNCNVVENREYVGKLGCDVVDDESVVEEQVVGESKYDMFLSRKSECDAKGVDHFSELENREKSLTLFAKWSNANQVLVSIQVNGKRYNNPLISIQQAISICDLYEEMIKKLGGSRGKPSLKLSTKVFSKVGKIEVTHKDLCTLRQTDWLNDNVVNAFATLAEYQSGKHIHFFSSIFLNSYKKYGFSSVKKYMSNNNIDKEQLTRLVFPINTGVHWLAVLVDVKRKLFCLYDSLHEPTQAQELSFLKRPMIKCVVEYVRELVNIHIQEWRFEFKNCPQQPNSYDCGVHTCMHLYCLCHEVPMKYDVISMLSLRGYIFHCILSKTLVH